MRILTVIHGTETEDYPTFRKRILDFARKEWLHRCAETLVAAITEEKPPAFSVIPFRKEKTALISADGVDTGAGLPDPPEGFSGAWAAEVAFPVVHRRNWELGEPSPGAGFITLFRKKKGIGKEEFLQRWFEGHTPLTLEVHPNVGYVRNHVLESLTSDSPVWDGIVEEQYDPPADLLNPARFFGGNVWRMPATMLRVLRDVRGFIDFSSIRTWLTTEYRLKA